MKRAWVLLTLIACTREAPPEAEVERPSILLVTLDTTRADAIGPGTPSFNALASRGRRFRYAYATVPETLPSHVSMMTGLYPAAHGIHENARQLATTQPLLAERLRDAGYRTAAFVSGYPLDRRFGLARGFETYDDDLGAGRVERSAKETTDRAIAYLAQAQSAPLFVWVHYFDPHHPYEPTYAAEVAAMDLQLGRLVAEFERRGAAAFLLVG
ncbi:MAG TPA: sulfatase, partial [Thermoanaerobaculia bacterium]